MVVIYIPYRDTNLRARCRTPKCIKPDERRPDTSYKKPLQADITQNSPAVLNRDLLLLTLPFCVSIDHPSSFEFFLSGRRDALSQTKLSGTFESSYFFYHRLYRNVPLILKSVLYESFSTSFDDLDPFLLGRHRSSSSTIINSGRLLISRSIPHSRKSMSVFCCRCLRAATSV